MCQVASLMNHGSFRFAIQCVELKAQQQKTLRSRILQVYISCRHSIYVMVFYCLIRFYQERQTAGFQSLTIDSAAGDMMDLNADMHDDPFTARLMDYTVLHFMSKVIIV